MSKVPTFIVITNQTGKVVTNDGMKAIEWCEHGKSSSVFESWREGQSAVPLSAHFGCTLS